jgi:hypothetical protein
MSILSDVKQENFNSVKDFLAANLFYQRVYYIPVDLKNKDWGCCPAYPSNEELLEKFADDECVYEIYIEPDCIKKSLIIYTRKAIKPGILFEGA